MSHLLVALFCSLAMDDSSYSYGGLHQCLSLTVIGEQRNRLLVRKEGLK